MKDLNELKIKSFDKILQLTDDFCKGIIFEEYQSKVLTVIDEYDEERKKPKNEWVSIGHKGLMIKKS